MVLDSGIQGKGRQQPKAIIKRISPCCGGGEIPCADCGAGYVSICEDVVAEAALCGPSPGPRAMVFGMSVGTIAG